MPTEKNRHGLSRDIPAAVARRVRQECAFSCVLCAQLPCHYDHFDPEFCDATVHAAESIALLCPSRHQDKTAGRLATSAVAAARANPAGKLGGAEWQSYLGPGPARLEFASNLATGTLVGVSVNGHPLLSINTAAPHPWRLSGNLVGPNGTEMIRFEENVIVASTGSWDVELRGKALTIREGPNQIVARLVFAADTNTIAVERLRMRLGNGHSLVGDTAKMTIDGPKTPKITMSGNQAGISGTFIQLGPKTPTDLTYAINLPVLGGLDDWTA